MQHMQPSFHAELLHKRRALNSSPQIMHNADRTPIYKRKEGHKLSDIIGAGLFKFTTFTHQQPGLLMYTIEEDITLVCTLSYHLLLSYLA